MEIKIYKTHEITNDIWAKVVAGFNASFEGHTTNIQQLLVGYQANHLGFCYHAIGFDGEIVVGFNSITPCKYHCGQTEIVIGLSGTTFVLKEYRKDIFIFNDLYNALKEHCQREGIVVFLGVPNKNSYAYSIKLLRCKEIFALQYWILPINIAQVLHKPKLRFMNILSRLYAHTALVISQFSSSLYNFQERKTKYRLNTNPAYLSSRLGQRKYINYSTETINVSYSVIDENGIKCAYILLFEENGAKSLKALTVCVQQILNSQTVDIIMYVGTLNIRQWLFTKTPRCFEPHKLPFTVNFLGRAQAQKYGDMLERRNWDFSLINFDVR